MTSKTSLIADIGGTNARFALADKSGYFDELTLDVMQYDTLEEAIDDYFVKTGVKSKPEKAAISIAGAVIGDKFGGANIHWSFSVSEVRKSMHFTEFHLYNDFEAIAMGIPHLQGKDVKQIGGGAIKEHSPKGVLGPGTGLGVASVVYTDGKYHPLKGEGGHVTAPVKTHREFAIVDVMLEKYHHISAERVCSGKGLVNLYEAIIEKDGCHELPARTAEEISAAALDGNCAVCTEALEIMVRMLGRVAGNLALTIGAFGGIYIAGGITSKLGQYFYDSSFREEFEAKGRQRGYMEQIPTFVVLHPQPAFLGLQKSLIDQ